MPIAAVSGSAGAIGTSVRSELEQAGYRVIGIDLHDAEVLADLSTPAGRKQAVIEVLNLCDGTLDALVCAAGLGGTVRPPSGIVAVNYFGVVALLEGLSGALARASQPAAVVISSISGTGSMCKGHAIEQACLQDRENAALEAADECANERDAYAAYACSKRAIAIKARQMAVEWAAQGMRLNIVAPGPVDTPLHHAALEDPVLGPAVRGFIPPSRQIATAGQVAQCISFLLSARASAMAGSVMFVDGGMDAKHRPQHF